MMIGRWLVVRQIVLCLVCALSCLKFNLYIVYLIQIARSMVYHYLGLHFVGLIAEIMSEGKRMTYEELCNAVLPVCHFI